MMETTIRPIAEGRSTYININVATITDCECALILGQIHYWIQVKENDNDEYCFHDGRYWVYNSVKKWKSMFPCFSEITIKRKLKKLRDMGILITGNYNSMKADRSLWYSIDYDRLNQLIAEYQDSIGSKRSDPLDQNDPMDCIKMTQPIPYNTTYNTIKENLINKSNGAESGDSAQCALQSDDAHPAPQGCDNNIISGNPDDTASRRNVPTTVVCKILDRQVKKCCNELGYRFEETREICKIIGYFFDVFNAEMGMPHPVLNNKTMTNCIIAIHDDYGKGDGSYFPYFDEYKPLIDSYFNKVNLECDFHLPHFVSGEIRQNLYYEIMSGCAV